MSISSRLLGLAELDMSDSVRPDERQDIARAQSEVSQRAREKAAAG
jgi:hypothetical protein